MIHSQTKRRPFFRWSYLDWMSNHVPDLWRIRIDLFVLFLAISAGCGFGAFQLYSSAELIYRNGNNVGDLVSVYDQYGNLTSKTDVITASNLAECETTVKGLSIPGYSWKRNSNFLKSHKQYTKDSFRNCGSMYFSSYIYSIEASIPFVPAALSLILFFPLIRSNRIKTTRRSIGSPSFVVLIVMCFLLFLPILLFEYLEDVREYSTFFSLQQDNLKLFDLYCICCIPLAVKVSLTSNLLESLYAVIISAIYTALLYAICFELWSIMGRGIIEIIFGKLEYGWSDGVLMHQSYLSDDISDSVVQFFVAISLLFTISFLNIRGPSQSHWSRVFYLFVLFSIASSFLMLVWSWISCPGFWSRYTGRDVEFVRDVYERASAMILGLVAIYSIVCPFIIDQVFSQIVQLGFKPRKS